MLTKIKFIKFRDIVDLKLSIPKFVKTRMCPQYTDAPSLSFSMFSGP